MPVCSFCQTSLAEAGQLHNHYPTFPEFVASGESCHVCRILLESLSEKPRGDIMDRVRSGSYSKVTVRISGEDAKVEVITNANLLSTNGSINASRSIHQVFHPKSTSSLLVCSTWEKTLVL
jgi:hypothetical protein